MRTIRRQAKATSLDHAIELAKRYAKEQHRPSKVMADLMGVELKTYYRWLLDNTLPLNRIAQFEALTGSRFISEYLSVLHGDRVVIEIPRGRKGKAADMAQVQSQTAEALALLAKTAFKRLGYSLVYPRARPQLKNALYSLFIAITPQPPRRLFHPRQNQVRRFKDFFPNSGCTMRP